MDFNIDALKEKKKHKQRPIFFAVALSKAIFEKARFSRRSRDTWCFNARFYYPLVL
jgi:hypothetical protein